MGFLPQYENLKGPHEEPEKTEIFLDESYIHGHHLHRLTWVKAHNIVYEPGHALMLVIFGAIAVGGKCHRCGYTAQIYDWRLLARSTGAGGLRTGADGHEDGERTWVECDSGMGGLLSVNDTSSEQCSLLGGR
jgi:hypothetical protein